MTALDIAMQAALRLASRGFPVFPCLASKKPACPRGFYDAVREADAVRRLWQTHPGILVGIPTGKASGIAVLDVDLAKHPEAEEWLQQHRSKLGETWITASESGGQHWYFQHRAGLRCSNSKITRGVDVRADGGYAVAWSAHGYPVLLDVPLAPWPSVLDDMLAAGAKKKLAALPSPDTFKAVNPDLLATVIHKLPNDEMFDDRTVWITLVHAIAAAYADHSDFGKALWLEHAGKREQVPPDEPERVWSSLRTPHRVGAEWIVAIAKARGIDVSAYENATVAAATAGPLSLRELSLPTPQESGNVEGKLSQRQRLIETARATDMNFWRDPDSIAYATVIRNGRTERHRVQSTGFRLLLRSLYAERWPERTVRGFIPGSVSDSAMAEALSALEAISLNGDVRHPDVRTMHWREAIWLDLGDIDWRLVRITDDGWRVVDSADVPLIRPAGMRALCVPQNAHDALAKLRRLLNINFDDDLKLIVVWLVAALYPHGPYLILAIDGEQGSGKNTACRMLRRLVDCNKADLRAPPKTEDDLVIAAGAGRVVGIDNLSRMSGEMMDAICRLATGTGIGKRKLYTDGEEVIFSAARPVLLNGIPSMLARGDLADRAISVTLQAIPDGRRRSEEVIWRDFAAAAPGILALLLNGIVTALGRLPTLSLKELPRMADFARLACAAAPAFGWTEADMLRAINDNRGAAVTAVIDAEPLADAIQAIIADPKNNSKRWQGTATDLLWEISTRVPFEQQRKPGWPRDGARLSGRLTRIAPALRRIGIVVEKLREGHQGGRIIVIRADEDKTASAASAASAAPLNQQVAADAAHAVADDSPGGSVSSNPLERNGADAADGAVGVSEGPKGGTQTRRNRAFGHGGDFGAFAAPSSLESACPEQADESD